MRVLIIEDEPDLLGALTQAVREAGFDVESTTDGRQGLNMALTGGHAAIVLDVMLPSLDGFEVLRGLRATRSTPVLMLTARDAVRDRVTGLETGADDYLTKPFETSELLARLRAMIRRSSGGIIAAESMSKTVATLQHAGEMQKRLTANHLRNVPGIDAAFDYQPSQWVSGDYCDLWTLPNDRVGFVVADVSGKGPAAAMVMSNVHAALRTSVAFCNSPAEAVDYVNRHLEEYLSDGTFVSLFLGILDVRTGKLEFVNAGHVPPLMIDGAGNMESLGAAANMVLGVGARSYAAETRWLTPGSLLLAVTDGVTESRSPQGELFGTARVGALFQHHAHADAEAVIRDLTRAASEFRGAIPPQDDLTVFALRWTGDPGSTPAAQTSP